MQASADHRDGPAAGGQRRLVGRRVDTRGEATDDNVVAVEQVPRDLGSLLEAGGRGFTAAHHGRGPLVSHAQLTPYEERRRAIVDHPQVHWIASVENRYQADALLLVGNHALLELVQGHFGGFDLEEARLPPSLFCLVK